MGLYEQILAFNNPSGRDSVKLTMLGGATPASLSLLRRSRDTVVMVSSFNSGWLEVATVDQTGRVTSVDATATTIKTRTHRAANIDFDGLAKSWTATEAARGRAGRMSPADTVRSVVGSANIEIVYSRPLKRGRQIWGSVVKWAEPWRTGANAATQLTTTADLVIGETTVPAGKYTLWTLPTATERSSSQYPDGQWGTVYIPLKTWSAFPSYRQCWLAIEQLRLRSHLRLQGRLRLSWDDREFSVPVRVNSPARWLGRGPGDALPLDLDLETMMKLG